MDRIARTLAALTAGLGAAVLLSSCAGVAPGAAAPTTAAAEVVATSTPSPTQTVVTPSPVATGAGTKSAVVPFVTSAVWDAEAEHLDVAALVPKIVEPDGTCTLTASLGDESVSEEGSAVAASSYTGCPQLVIDGEDLAPGDWTVTVSYASGESSGTSVPAVVTVG